MSPFTMNSFKIPMQLFSNLHWDNLANKRLFIWSTISFSRWLYFYTAVSLFCSAVDVCLGSFVFSFWCWVSLGVRGLAATAPTSIVLLLAPSSVCSCCLSAEFVSYRCALGVWVSCAFTFSDQLLLVLFWCWISWVTGLHIIMFQII